MNELSRTMDQSQILIHNYGLWPPPPTAPPPLEEPVPIMFQTSQRPIFAPARSNWKAKKLDKRRNDYPLGLNLTCAGGGSGSGSGSGSGGGGGGGGYNKPPNSNDLQSQNRSKNRRFHSRKKFYSRFAPFAPRNTTSFIIRAKKSGGIASLVSPCPVTPAVLPTPTFSPSKEVLVDMAKEEWGVDGYGSMNGLIRLRSPRGDDDDDEDEGGSSGSDVEEHVEVERRLDHDLSRFEMIYPNYGYEHTGSVLGNRVDDQDTHIAQLEEENLTLKERLFLMESELEDLRRRVRCLETNRGRVRYNNEEEASEINAWDNEGSDDVCSEKSVGDGDGD